MSVSATCAQDEAAARLATGVVSYVLNISFNEIIDDARGSADVAFARQVAMYLCHVAFELSLARVATAFGRDRSPAPQAREPFRALLEETRQTSPARTATFQETGMFGRGALTPTPRAATFVNGPSADALSAAKQPDAPSRNGPAQSLGARAGALGILAENASFTGEGHAPVGGYP